MTWGFKRQIFYIGVLVAFVLVFGFLIIRPSFKKMPTCMDGKQNGTETGIDCGGSCARACLAEVDKVSVLWARAFRVVPGRYNAVVYLENHNPTAAVNKINYRFRFADKNNIYIGKREGSTYIPPASKFAIFEPAIDIGYSIPVYTSFEFTEAPQWITISEEKKNQLQIGVSGVNLSSEKTSPILSAVLKNNSLFAIPELSVVAILYDANHNALSTSRTYLDTLSGEETKQITFTWPEPLEGEVVFKEIIPMFNILRVELK